MSTAYKKMTSHGSISIPVAMRRELGIEPKDPMIVEEHQGEIRIKLMLSRLVDTFFSRTSWTMLLYAENHSISVA